jgi:hypothetical protein
MSCPACVECVENEVARQVGSCEQELLDAIKSELFKTLAALPPHLQRYLSCRLGLAAPAALQKFDVGQLIAALPAIVQLLIQLGILPLPKGPSPSPAAPQAATTDAWLRAVAAAAAAFAASTAPAPTSPAPAAQDPAGYLPRVARRCA